MSGTNLPRVGIRISAEGADLARAKVEAFGTSGEAAMRRVATATAAVNPQMQRLAEVSDVANRAFVGMGGNLGRVGSTFTGVAGVASGLTAGFLALGAAATGAGVAIAKSGDTAIATMARLSSATGSLSAAQTAYEGLFKLSQQTGVAVAESAGSFSRFSVAAKEIGGTNEQVLKLVSGIQKAGIVAGSTTQEVSAGVQQIGQALASGALQGDELRSLLENMPQLGQALARELGVGLGQLKAMGSEGQLTADRVFPALLRAAERMSGEFDKMPPTMSRAFDILGAAMVNFTAKLDEALGLSQKIAAAANAAAAAVNNVQRRILPTDAQAADNAVAAAQGRLASVQAQIAAERGASAYGDVSPAFAEALRIAEEELRDSLARQNAIRRDQREIERADTEAALRQGAETRTRAAQKEADEDRLKYDKAAKAQAEYWARVEAINKAAAAGVTKYKNGDVFSPGDQLIAAAQDYVDELKKIEDQGKKTGTALKQASEAGDGRDRFEEAAMKALEKEQDRIAKEQERDIREAEAQYQRSYDAVASMGERAFDRIGDAAVNALFLAEGQTIRWGNVFKGVIASVAADLAKLAIVNPVINSLTAATGSAVRPTLGGAGLGDLLGLGGISDMLGLTSIKDTIGGFLGGAGSINGAWTSLVGATPLGPTLSGAPLSATSGLLNLSGQSLIGSVPLTMSSALSGIGLGFGAGTLLNGVLGGNSTGGMVGSGLGSAAGFLLGGPVGALLGGLGGGALGGLIGNNKQPSQGWSYGLYGMGGKLTLDNVYSSAAGAQQEAQARQTVEQINAFMAAQGLQASGARAVGGNRFGVGNLGYGEAASFDEAFGALRFTAANNNDLNRALSGRSFADPGSLQQFVAGLTEVQAVIKQMTADAVPAFKTQMDGVYESFAVAANRAREYGLAEDSLTDARDKAVAALEAQRAETLRATMTALDIRSLTARGQTQEADLARQAEAARAEIDAFSASLDTLAITAEDKAARLVRLEEVQAQERAAIVAKYGEQTLAQQRRDLEAGQSLINQLAFGSASALAPEQKYFAALTTLNKARQDLEAGGSLADYAGVAQQVLPVARDFLGTSTRYGGLAAEVASVINARGGDAANLSAIISAQVSGTDALTSLTAAIGDRTVGELVAIRNEVARLSSTLEALIARRIAA